MIQTRSLRNSNKYHIFSNAIIQQSKIFSISAKVRQNKNCCFFIALSTAILIQGNPDMFVSNEKYLDFKKTVNERQ